MNDLLKMFGLSGKVAVVTGAAGQLGGEFSSALIGAGASVAAFDINFDNPESKLSRINSENISKITVNITDKESIKKGLNEALKRFSKIDILINNAAIDVPPDSSGRETGPFESFSEVSWNKTLDVNLTGTFYCCQVIGGSMAESWGGSIINISSIYGMVSPNHSIYDYKKKKGETFFKPVAYSVSKSGIYNLTRYLATYWAKRNVRVNTLTLAGVFNNQDEEFLQSYCKNIPIGRMANKDEYNGAVLFLSSEASKYMTGSNMVIDGGWTAW